MGHPSRRRWSIVLVLGLVAFLGVVVGTFSPAQAVTPVATVDDATTSGTNRFAFSGTWVTCTGCNTGAYQNSFKYSATSGSALTFTFVGGQAALYGFKEPQGGIATVSVDGGAAVDVDYYSASRALVPVFTTPALASGTHTVTLTVSGRTSNLYTAVNIDKGEVYAATATTTTTTTVPTTTTTVPTTTTTVPTTTTTVPTTTTTVPTTTTTTTAPPTTTTTTTTTPVSSVTVDDAVTSGTNRFAYSGTWVTCGGCNAGAYQGSFRYAPFSGASLTFTFTGSQAALKGFKEPQGGIAAVSVDGGSSSDVSFFASSQSLSTVYTTPVLANGSHVVTLSFTGRTQGSSATINIDSATVSSGGVVPTTTTTVPTTTTTVPTTTTTVPTTTTTTTAPPTTTTTTTTTPVSSVTVDDAVTSGTNRFAYSGTWVTCGGCNAGAYQGSFRYAPFSGASLTFTFTGSQAALKGFKEPQGGIAAVSVDGGSSSDVSFFASSQSLSTVYTTPVLANGSHVVTLSFTGRTQGSSATINIDSATVSSGGVVPTTTTTVPTTTTTTVPVPTQGTVSFTFDDGKMSQYDYARPALNAAGFKGTFYIISDALTWGSANMNASQVSQVASEGHEIGNHSKSHPYLSQMSAAALQQEFADSQAAISSATGVTPRSCAYPYGSYNATVTSVAAQYFRSCRTTEGGQNTASTDHYTLATFYVHTSTTGAMIRAAVDQAKANGTWLILCYHGVGVADGGYGDDVDGPTFQSHLDAVKASGVTVKTVGAVIG